MPLDITALRANRAAFDVEYQGEAVRLVYMPEQYDAGAHDRLMQARSVGDYADLLADLLCAWDVTDNGLAIAPDRDNLRRLSFAFLSTIARGLMEDVSDPKQPMAGDRTPPAPGSPVEAPSASVPAGTSSSSPVVISTSTPPSQPV